MMKMQFQITGMSCDHCINSIEESLSRLAGVEQCRVTMGEVMVSFDENQIDKSKMIEAIRSAGSFDVSGFHRCD